MESKTTNDSKRILVVDDEEDICDILKFNLESEGYEVFTANSAEEALKIDIASFNLLLLDVMMEGISGFQLAKKIKTNDKTSHIPIIFLTARGSENDTITGLTIGADDYIVKPFSIKIVTLRIKAVLNRQSHHSSNDTISFHSLSIDTRRHKVNVNGNEVQLTKKEYEILKFFLENRDQVFTRDEILSSAWEDTYVLARTVDVNITRLRKKIGNYGQHIVTCQGYGYRFDSDRNE